ncbi:MAG: xanthine dehydrogenase small subunit [Pseudomonadota bacterium]
MIEPISFSLNGEPVSAALRADTTVLEYLRLHAALRGTKEGCAEGDCGACSVLVRKPGEERFQPANACIMLLAQVHGGALVTVEGLAAQDHVVQKVLAENGSSQCGFCTPGIVAALAGLLDANKNPSESDIHDGLAGNLCRCTGYRPVVEAAQKAAKSAPPALPHAAVENGGKVTGHDQSQALHPSTLDELFEMRAAHPHHVLLGGGTDSALDVAHARSRWPVIINTAGVEELRGVEKRAGDLIIGGAASWADILPHLARHWPSFAKLVRRFGSVQIRAMGTVAGNIATASPIGDGAPSLIALGAKIHLAGPKGERSLPLEEFFLDYRQTVLGGDEIIRAIHVPLPKPGEDFRVYKVSKRYDQDISTVCGAFAFRHEDNRLSHVRVAYGGMAATPLRCVQVETVLEGQALTQTTLSAARSAVKSTFTPLSDMRGSADYRARVASNLLDRLAAELAGETVEVMAL